MTNGIRAALCLLIIGVLFLLPSVTFCVQWQELKSEHFFVYFVNHEKPAQKVLLKAEKYYRDIASDLGYPRYKDFWTWDKRAKIYIYPDYAAYLEATGQPAWSHGVAYYGRKAIVTYEFSSEFMDGLLPHELAHLIFRDFVGFRGEVPLWLDEGVAQWAESLKREHIKEMAGYLYETGSLIPLKEMMNIDIRKIKDDDKIDMVRQDASGKEKTVTLGAQEVVNTYYIQSVALVGFLIESYGSLSFADFCRQLRDGKSLDDALKSAYGTTMQDIGGLEKKWKHYLKNLKP